MLAFRGYITEQLLFGRYSTAYSFLMSSPRSGRLPGKTPKTYESNKNSPRPS